LLRRPAAEKHREYVREVRQWYRQAGVEPDPIAVNAGGSRMADEWNARWSERE
jgi:hypothetical protein